MEAGPEVDGCSMNLPPVAGRRRIPLVSFPHRIVYHVAMRQPCSSILVVLQCAQRMKETVDCLNIIMYMIFKRDGMHHSFVFT